MLNNLIVSCKLVDDLLSTELAPGDNTDKDNFDSPPVLIQDVILPVQVDENSNS